MATIAEKSRTKEIIDRLQTVLNNASPVPLAAGKVTIYKDEVQSLLNELASQIEIELKTYHEVNDRKGKIISEAKKEAEQIIFQAEHTASRMRVSKRTTGVAPVDYDRLDEESRSALGNANEIYAASLIYTDEMLTEVTDMISDAYHNIRSDYEIILQVMEEKLNTIQNNRTELMEELQDMDTADRSQQILEIGELLSNELYTSRMRARMNSDEYEDGSVQLSLDLQDVQAEQEEKARQAEEVAKQATEALAEVTAQRDALMETVARMRQQGMGQAIQSVRAQHPVPTPEKPEKGESLAASTVKREEDAFAKQTAPEQTEEIEYEYVYVTEDELEEGEEYEIEYVDEYENPVGTEQAVAEKMPPASEATETKEAVLEHENPEQKGTPVIPHFKKSQKVATVSSEKISDMAAAISTDEKYSGLISRAGKEPVQAVLKEETDYEIVEF